jgi:TRAP-type mannitol/chloroaromatic compound transport system permease large subunit
VRKELWFGLSLMAVILTAVAVFMPAPWRMTNEHLGLLMLSLIVVAIMLGFPTAFTLMGMGVVFAWLAYRGAGPDLATTLTLDLMVHRTFAVMSNEVLIAIPLFVFMGYLVERANLIERLFTSVHLALAWLPGSLAVATLVTSALFATATGIIGAVVTLMGLLAFPAMLRAGYGVRLSAGAITAGGCLGILIPPSVMLILYGATAGVSVVQLYAGAFFPGLMLTALYVLYVVVVARLRPDLAPPLAESERHIEVPAALRGLVRRPGAPALPALLAALVRPRRAAVPRRSLLGGLATALFPAVMLGIVVLLTHQMLGAPSEAGVSGGPAPLGFSGEQLTALGAEGLAEPPGAGTPPEGEGEDGPPWAWRVLAIGALLLAVGYWLLTFERLEILKMLLASFFPLALMIAAVLGSIVFGLATPAEAAAAGALGGFVLTAAYQLAREPGTRRRRLLAAWALPAALVLAVFGGALVLGWRPPPVLVAAAWAAAAALALLATWQLRLGGVVRESVFLTAKTSAMVCWLFVGSSIFSAAFALLGGQALIERWVLSLDLTPIQFLVLAQVIIFLLGWPLEWTEIIVIFMPIFIPLLAHFEVDPLFFGLLVALNLQTAFLSPPVAMAAFYLKGVAPAHVTLNQIFAGVLPFMAIQLLAILLLYVFPEIGLWLPRVLYR